MTHGHSGDRIALWLLQAHVFFYLKNNVNPLLYAVVMWSSIFEGWHTYAQLRLNEAIPKLSLLMQAREPWREQWLRARLRFDVDLRAIYLYYNPNIPKIHQNMTDDSHGDSIGDDRRCVFSPRRKGNTVGMQQEPCWPVDHADHARDVRLCRVMVVRFTGEDRIFGVVPFSSRSFLFSGRWQIEGLDHVGTPSPWAEEFESMISRSTA